MTFEKPVCFLNNNQKLFGILHLPKEKGKFPAIVFCHGFMGHKLGARHGGRLFVKAGRTLAEEGFAVLRFDFRGSGDSDGEFEDMTTSGEIDDLKAALKFLETVKQIDKKRIGVVGLSLGGTVAICTAAEDHRIRAVASWSGVAFLEDVFRVNIIGEENYHKLMKNGFYDIVREGQPVGYRISKKFFMDLKNHNPIQAIAKISPRPVLIIHGTKDVVVPPENAEALYKNAGNPKELRWIEGADHVFMERDKTAEVIAVTTKWFKDVFF
jgi:dipeptidyl aminopeptidase/acylaminoacyl peptidase